MATIAITEMITRGRTTARNKPESRKRLSVGLVSVCMLARDGANEGKGKGDNVGGEV